jgi:hypothetical protein
MTDLFSSAVPNIDFGSDVMCRTEPDVPAVLDKLPDGHEALKIGDLHEIKDLISHQGDNDYQIKGTCGLVSCTNSQPPLVPPRTNWVM